MSTFTEMLLTLGLGILVVAGLSVAVSRKANTPAVIQSAGSAFSNALGIAEAPVTGATYSPVLSYPGTDLTGGFGYGS